MMDRKHPTEKSGLPKTAARGRSKLTKPTHHHSRLHPYILSAGPTLPTSIVHSAESRNALPANSPLAHISGIASQASTSTAYIHPGDNVHTKIAIPVKIAPRDSELNTEHILDSTPTSDISPQDLQESEDRLVQTMRGDDFYFSTYPEIMEGSHFDERAGTVTDEAGANDQLADSSCPLPPPSHISQEDVVGISSQQAKDPNTSPKIPYPQPTTKSKPYADIYWNEYQLPPARIKLTSSCFLGKVPLPIFAFQGRGIIRYCREN